MPRRSTAAIDRVEPDRIGRMDARIGREPSVNSQLARRLQGQRSRTKSATAMRGKQSGSSYGSRQRVVVKALVSRHKPGKAGGSLARHASYLGRESASADGQPGVFYDAARDGVNARQAVVPWAEDRHHFRLIVSPEHGADIPDITAYVREAMRRVQRDLDTELTWVAVNHHNTDNPHAHVMVRGKRSDGTDLVIPRHYISYGIRDRASEVATELLGQRSVAEVQSARTKEVTAERFTSLDRMIERHLERGRIDVSPDRRIGFEADDHKLVVGRLQFLESVDLAKKGRGTQWEVDGEFKSALRELGARNDIIHQLYRSMGTEAGRVQRMALAESSTPVSGVVVAKGSIDEISEERFVVVRDRAGKAHYGQVRDGTAYQQLRIGAVAELGAGAYRRQKTDEQIVAVARTDGGVYSPQLHEAYLRALLPAAPDQQIESALRSVSGRLTFVANDDRSGVVALSGGRYQIEPSLFEPYSQRPTQRTDVRVISDYSVNEQVNAHAVTWIDRQAFGDRPDERTLGHPAVQQAIEKREAWLVEHGYAEQLALANVRLLPGALKQLAAEERVGMAQRLADLHGYPVTELPQGGTVTGIYKGTQELHAGRQAVVVADELVFVSPVRNPPDAATGSEVTLHRTGARDSGVESVLASERSTVLERGLDGLEAGA
jgi:type IV secretory pathway VirD2 relaxase